MSLKVYYLDDEPFLLETFKENFSNKDIEIETFSSSAPFEAACKENPPDLVFIDFRLVGENGDQVSSRICPSIPRALVSGDLSVEVKNTFSAVFEKPYKIEKIENFLKMELAKKK